MPKTLIIDADQEGIDYWKEIWSFRELAYFLAWRDVLIRYKQTLIGLLWVIIRPLIVMVTFTLIFGRLANLAPQEIIPYPILVLSALLPWQFFSTTIGACSESLVANAQLVSKIYFPRLIIPISSTIVNLFDFVITLVLLAFILTYYQFSPSWTIILLPLFLLQLILLTFGIGTWISALNVKYRDFKHIIPFAIQFGLFITPIGFTTQVVPEQWRLLFGMNPLVGIIDAFRWAITGTPLDLTTYYLSCILTLLILFGSIRYFRNVEKTFADII